MAALARRLGAFDILLITMGSLIGSGIFRTPSVVAQRVHSPTLMLGAWIVGGIVALFGACVLGELAARRPDGCGAYAYLRDAFHPLVAFAFGWTSLLVAFSGGIAAAAVLFAGYVRPLSGLHVDPTILAITTIVAFTLVNFLGVRTGGNTQNALTLLKTLAVGAIIIAGFAAHPVGAQVAPAVDSRTNVLAGFGVAMIPVLFAYNGAILVTFMTTETKVAARAVPCGLWGGMLTVMLLYVLVNVACIRVLGTTGLAQTTTPASDILRIATGSVGERLVALAIAISTLGFISNRILTAPRLYQAMAQDGLFFRQVAQISPKTHVPVVAIALQGACVIVIVLSGTYEHILNYVVSTSYVFMGLLAVALFVIRSQDRSSGTAEVGRFRVPLHPISTLLVVGVSWAVAADTYITYPRDGLIGLGILLSAVAVYLIWSRRKR